MNTSDVQAMVTEAVEHEKQTNAVRQRLSKTLPAEATGPAQQFLIAYAESTPVLMEGMQDFLGRHNALPQFQPMFDLMFSYWANPSDVIPDDQGLVGILDDAYVAKRSLQQINEQFGQVAGVPVVAANLAKENQLMRPILGAAIIDQLDAIVAQGNQSLGGWIRASPSLSHP